MERKKNGFTLVELLAVIVVLAIIMIIALPNVLDSLSTAKEKSFKEMAIKMYNEAQKKDQLCSLGESADCAQALGTDWASGLNGWAISSLQSETGNYTGAVIKHNNKLYVVLQDTKDGYNFVSKKDKATESETVSSITTSSCAFDSSDNLTC